MRNVEVPLSASDGYVTKPAFFFEILLARRGTRMWEEPFFHSDDKYRGELEALRGVHRHQRHASVGPILIGVSHKRGVIDEVLQSLALLFSFNCGCHEFFDVQQPPFGFDALLFFKRSHVTGLKRRGLHYF